MVLEYDLSKYPTSPDCSTKTGKRYPSASSNPRSPDPDPNKKTQKLFITANRYELLAQSESANSPVNPPSETPIIAGKIKLPPPMFVKGVIFFPDLCSSLIEIIGVDNFFCKSSTDSLKIQTSNPESYRILIHFLKDKKAQYHTFQLKEDKPTRFVIRNLHTSTSIDLIKSELKLRLFEVRKVTNVLHKTSKCPLPLFFVDLEPTYYSNDIFKLSSLLYIKVKVDEPYNPKVISQCLNCQEYGHTRAYCGYSARCVSRSAFHSSPECSKLRDSPAKCALCSGDHPANYRGCSVYKELQRRKNLSQVMFLYQKMLDISLIMYKLATQQMVLHQTFPHPTPRLLQANHKTFLHTNQLLTLILQISWKNLKLL